LCHGLVTAVARVDIDNQKAGLCRRRNADIGVGVTLGPLGDLLQVRRGSVVATAASDNVLSRHYGDLLRRWRDGQYTRIR